MAHAARRPYQSTWSCGQTRVSRHRVEICSCSSSKPITLLTLATAGWFPPIPSGPNHRAGILCPGRNHQTRPRVLFGYELTWTEFIPWMMPGTKLVFSNSPEAWGEQQSNSSQNRAGMRTIPSYVQSSRLRETESRASGTCHRPWKLPFSQRRGQSGCPPPHPGLAVTRLRAELALGTARH